jgi:prepilin-type N-terminal cleavage/methylation domain-containing protein
MLSLKRQFGPDRSASPRFACVPLQKAFTLIEIVIALAVLGTMAAGVYVGFNAINTYAVSSRLYSEAQTAAQNQIDLVLSKEPFDIAAAKISGTFNPCLNKVPAELMTTTELDALTTSATCAVTFPSQPPTSTPAKTDAYYPYYPYYRTGANQPLKREAFIYRDAVTGTILVTGTLTSTIVDTNATMTPFADPSATATPSPLNTRKANVSVLYTFRGKTYNVVMDTLRTANQ